MLIIEGPDGVGKTTLARELAKDLPGYVYKHFGPLDDEFHFCVDYMQHAVKKSVQDRFHMSEFVYGSVLRGQSRIHPEAYRLVDAHLRMMGAFTVVITADQEILGQRYGEKDELFSFNDVLEVNKGFIEAMDPSTTFCDWDYHIHCARSNPFITKFQYDDILDQYGRRQLRLRQLLGVS